MQIWIRLFSDPDRSDTNLQPRLHFECPLSTWLHFEPIRYSSWILTSMRTRVQLLTLMRIRIRLFTQMRIHIRLPKSYAPDTSQALFHPSLSRFDREYVKVLRITLVLLFWATSNVKHLPVLFIKTFFSKSRQFLLRHPVPEARWKYTVVTLLSNNSDIVWCGFYMAAVV
jgi:hypothetical protein